LSKDLTAERALIFRITHRDNVPWFLQHGLHCPNSKTRDPKHVSIGNPELIEKRKGRIVPIAPGGSLSDYVPFYFTPHSPMLYNIRTGWGGIRKCENKDIVILVASLHDLEKQKVRFVFTDRHAFLQTAQFFGSLKQLNEIDWIILQGRDFKRNENDPGKVERYQAEALIHSGMPIAGLRGIVCHSDAVVDQINQACAQRNLSVKVIKKPEWYFA
jgi:hypothetical protein